MLPSFLSVWSSSTRGGVEAMIALIATLGYQQSYTILMFGTKNGFNNMKKGAILPALVNLIPSLVPYALNL